LGFNKIDDRVLKVGFFANWRSRKKSNFAHSQKDFYGADVLYMAVEGRL
jgi:hypothetical protein